METRKDKIPQDSLFKLPQIRTPKREHLMPLIWVICPGYCGLHSEEKRELKWKSGYCSKGHGYYHYHSLLGNQNMPKIHFGSQLAQVKYKARRFICQDLNKSTLLLKE